MHSHLKRITSLLMVAIMLTTCLTTNITAYADTVVYNIIAVDPDGYELRNGNFSDNVYTTVSDLKSFIDTEFSGEIDNYGEYDLTREENTEKVAVTDEWLASYTSGDVPAIYVNFHGIPTSITYNIHLLGRTGDSSTYVYEGVLTTRDEVWEIANGHWPDGPGDNGTFTEMIYKDSAGTQVVSNTYLSGISLGSTIDLYLGINEPPIPSGPGRNFVFKASVASLLISDYELHTVVSSVCNS